MSLATTIGAFEAKNTFSDLLEKVGRGAEITITKHDKPVARLVPVGDVSRRPGQGGGRTARHEQRL